MLEGEIVSNTLQIAPCNKYYQWTVDHTPGSSSMYMTTIYNYFCKKNDIFRLFESKKCMKICPKTHQIAPFISGNPLSNAWLRHASQVSPPPQKKIRGGRVGRRPPPP